MLKRGYRNILTDKQGQGIMGLPFSTIFSIFLIITFLGFAIYVIMNFLIPFLNCSKVGTFGEDLQDKITDAWNVDYVNSTFIGNLPSGIKKICFANLTVPSKGDQNTKTIWNELEQRFKYKKANMFFYPIGKGCDDLPYKNIEHIDMSKITLSSNPYCVNVKGGKVSLKIIKDSNLVLIE
jgi:hypothetical protein